MHLTTLETAEKVPFNLDGHKMFTNEKVELVHLALKPNEEIALHANPFDVIFFVLEGAGLVLFEKEIFNVEPNTSIFIEKDKQRGMRNHSNSIFRVLVCKVF
ncbi:MAG: cupin domain-containing protein [Bacteroidales bacterium]|nr:MAG: cupin domain-containing protein [Bacteroidales bacterium]